MNNVIAIPTDNKTFILKTSMYHLCDTVTAKQYGIIHVSYWGDVPVIVGYNIQSAIELSEAEVRLICSKLDDNAMAMRSHTLFNGNNELTLLPEPQFFHVEDNLHLYTLNYYIGG